MITQPTLTREEWALVLELLDQELHELPGEIHHTDRANYREKLQTRRVAVEKVQQAIRQALDAWRASSMREAATD
ncbi:MAG TPA: hypothetical protein PLS53_03635 [Thermoanaerobaculaceae bacterium]|nr:hypothetical protein [Thermoanaerobaculaceae bacterium]